MTFWYPIVVIGIGQFIDIVILQLLVPELQLILIQNYFTFEKDSRYESSLVTAFIFIIFSMLSLNRYIYYESQSIGVKITSACISLIRQKIIKLNLSILGSKTQRQVKEIFDNHIDNYGEFILNFNHLWIIPIQVFIYHHVF